MSSAPPRYTTTAIALHWLLAPALLALLALGIYMTELPLSPARLRLYNWHKWAGMTVALLSLLRLAWRLTHRPPPHEDLPRWQAGVAHAAHLLLYVLFFAVPLAGWVYSSAAGVPIVWFGVLPLPDLVAPDRGLAEAIRPLHGALAYALAALVAVHVAAALKHHWFDGLDTLRRMWPWWPARR
ncbi:MAG TPA: cytochrome b/b6 domain-containing protein [Rubrivivax sp.]|nr:cytochrome b/b6 domain-containing protein [Burkholderiales bacterium]HNT39867.1 cytochrome b/b6 domain-containing protein [Rubrivivax sp.]